MTGYLSRLAGRATTSTTVVRPRVPARFQAPEADIGQQGSTSSTDDDQELRQSGVTEPRGRIPSAEAATGARDQAAESRDTDARPSPQHPTSERPLAISTAKTDRVSIRRPATGPISDGDPAGTTNQSTAPRHAQARPSPQRPADEQPATVTTDQTAAPQHTQARPSPQHPANDRVSVSEPNVVAAVPTPSQVDLPFTDAAPTPAEETVVSIHIGRVDVRTPSPSASRATAPRQPRPAPEPSRLTLSEFLRGEREAR